MTKLSSLLCLVFALGCSNVSPQGDDQGDTGGKADGVDSVKGTIFFAAGYKQSVAGKIVAGKKIRINYNISRLDKCRASSNGLEAWGISGHYIIDGGEPQELEVARLENSVLTAVQPVITVQGSDIAFYFESTNIWGCHEFDSDNGANYHFAVDGGEGTSVAVLDFSSDSTVTQTGNIVAGSELVVHYDLDRIRTCRATYQGMPAWNITGYYSVDGRAFKTFNVTSPTGVGGGFQQSDAVIRVPEGSDLAIYFVNTDYSGCVSYDSNLGKNFHFTIE